MSRRLPATGLCWGLHACVGARSTHWKVLCVVQCALDLDFLGGLVNFGRFPSFKNTNASDISLGGGFSHGGLPSSPCAMRFKRESEGGQTKMANLSRGETDTGSTKRTLLHVVVFFVFGQPLFARPSLVRHFGSLFWEWV